MKNKTIIITAIIFSLIIPSLAQASWWNPFTWFSKKAVPLPVVQVYAPTPVIENNKQVEKKKENLEIKQTVEINTQIELENAQKKVTETKTEKEKLLAISKRMEGNPNPAAVMAKNAFLAHPTIDNLTVFCTSAKNISGTGTKKVLDSKRETMISVNVTLYEEMKICKMAEPSSGYVFLPLDNNLLVELKNSDTDTVREDKVRYNDKVKDLINNSKARFTGFKKVDEQTGETFKPFERELLEIDEYFD